MNNRCDLLFKRTKQDKINEIITRTTNEVRREKELQNLQKETHKAVMLEIRQEEKKAKETTKRLVYYLDDDNIIKNFNLPKM